MKKFTQIAILLAIVVSLTSCVARKKYDAETASRASAEERNRNLNNQLGTLSAENETLRSSLKANEAENMNQDAILKKRAADLDNRERAITDLRARLQARDKAMTDLREKLKNALNQFPEADLSIEVRDGKVYIAISDKMLFKSGSDKVEPLGKEALHKVAEVMAIYTDMDLIIEGHTDNVPIKTAKYTDNWDLSVARATSVVRILTVVYGLSPTKVTPSGRGEFFPKASNETAEGKSKNRRTEIIIAPKLDEIQAMVWK